ncbi:MAG: M1 family metallopeptidase [Anaerolineae bacterium]|nr:M1 family metallopeptidase [Anaerolineae bacterium]
MLKHRLPLLFLLVWLGTGCNLTSAVQVDVLIPPSPTTVTMLQSTPVPTLERIYQAVATISTDPPVTPAENTEAPTPEPACGLDVTVPTTRHTIQATMDFHAQTVVVDQVITYINRSGKTLNDFVLNIEPNRYPGAFSLFSLAQGRQTPTFDLTGRRLLINLIEPLETSCALKLQLSFLVTVPAVSDGVQAFKGFFGHSERQLNLGHWLPTVALRAGDEWITRQSVFVGEQEVLTDADWDVTLKVNQAGETLMVAAPGEVTQLKPNQWRYVLANSRDFTMSLSEEFTLNKVTTENGITLELYTFPDAKVDTQGGILDGANHALLTGKQALETYSTLFGDYPYSRMLVIQGDFPDGMEFSSLVFVSTTWFKQFTGDPAGFLTLITVHEIAHQWWYARVGNDPALAPWLDEALATYSEFIYLEEYYPELKDWWWQFRVRDYAPDGFVDSTVYEFSSIREYINAIYLRGVLMLDALREDLGTEAFFAWLKAYASAGAGEVVTPGFLWSLLTPEQLEATLNTRNLYLRKPQVTTP